MQKKILVLFGVFCLISVFAGATVVQGSVPNQGSKAYTFTANSSGIALLSLIFESKTADLDIRLAAPDPNNNNALVPVAFSESELVRQEELQIGILGGIQYTIIVFSSQGGSPFRLSFEGTFTTAGAHGQAGVAAPAGAQLEEVQHPSAGLLKFIEDTRKHSAQFKKK